MADDTRTGNVYAGAFQFADQKAPQRITQDFAVYTTSVKGVKQKDDTTLLVRLSHSSLRLERFLLLTYFLNCHIVAHFVA